MSNTPLQDIQQFQTDAEIFSAWLHDPVGTDVDFSAGAGTDERPSLATFLAGLNKLSTQSGTAYTIQSTDEWSTISFTNSSPVNVILPNNFAAGFAVKLLQSAAGQVNASASPGASLVTPNLETTQVQYGWLLCLVIANSSGTNAEWLVAAEPSQGGGGIVGATTLANLYSEDTAAHYAQWSVAYVFTDGANTGTWLKTGSGNGSGNWTQQPWPTLPSVNSAVTSEIARAQSSETGIFQALAATQSYQWADDGNFVGGMVDTTGNAIFAILSNGAAVGSSADRLLNAAGYMWNDEALAALCPAGTVPIVDGSGSVIVPYSTSVLQAYSLDKYAPYTGSDGNVYLTNNAAATAGKDFLVAQTRGTVRGAAASKGTVLRWMDDATASGNQPYHEDRWFDASGGNYLATLGTSITKLVCVVDTGHSLTVGGIASLLTTTPPFARGVMFNGGPKVVQPTGAGSNWNAPAPICDDAQLQSLAEFYEFQNSGGQGESHGGGVVTWFGTGAHLGSTEAVLFATVGAGGATLANLLSGTTQFSNLIRVVERAAALAAYNGWAFEAYVCCSIGENDYATYQASASGFSTNMLAMQSSIETAIQAIFTKNGWSAPAHVPIVCMQPSSWNSSNFNSGNGYNTDALAYVFPALVRSNPNQFALVGPEYYVDNYAGGTPGQDIHMSDIGYKLVGQYMARAVQKLRASAAVPGVVVTGVSNSGNAVTVTTGATSNLAIDTSVVSDPGQYGLRVLDVTAGNANIALSGIAVSGTSITFTLASHVAGHTLMLGVGDYGVAPQSALGPTTCPRTCVRDSSADVSSSDTGSTPMYNYLCHDQINWTAAA